MPHDLALPKRESLLTIDNVKRESPLDDHHRGTRQIVAILGDAPGRRNKPSRS